MHRFQRFHGWHPTPRARRHVLSGCAAATLLLLAACGGGGGDSGDSGTASSAASSSAPDLNAAAPPPAPAPAAAPPPAPAPAAAPPPAPAPAAAPPPAPAPGAAPPPAPAPGGSSAGTCNLAGFQAEALQMINARRAAGATCGSRGAFAATAPLAWNTALTQSAVRHSSDMVARNFFSHTGSDGTNAGSRASAAGYAWSGWGENIAAGQGSVAAVMAGWMASDGHCANIMNPGFRDVGLACVAGSAGNAYGTYWTMVLATPR